MRYNRQLKKIIGLSLIPIAIITIIFSYLQIKYKDVAAYAILNNVFICVLTGGIVAFFQAIIGYENSKHDCILSFYKDVIMVEDKINHYPYNRLGFIEAQNGLKDVAEITSLFDGGATYSYLQIDFGGKSNEVLNAVKKLYSSYNKHIKVYRELDSDLCDALSFLSASEEELITKGIKDIPEENRKINLKLQEKAEEICTIYNDEQDRKIRNEAYAVLEQYLFKQKVK